MVSRHCLTTCTSQVGRPIALTFAPPPHEEEEEETGAELPNEEADQDNGQETAEVLEELPKLEGTLPAPPQQLGEEPLLQQEEEVTRLEVAQLQAQEDLQEPGRQAEPPVQPEQPMQVEQVRQSEQEEPQPQLQEQQEQEQAQEQTEDLLPQEQEHVVKEEALHAACFGPARSQNESLIRLEIC